MAAGRLAPRSMRPHPAFQASCQHAPSAALFRSQLLRFARARRRRSSRTRRCRPRAQVPLAFLFLVEAVLKGLHAVQTFLVLVAEVVLAEFVLMIMMRTLAITILIAEAGKAPRT